MRQRRVLLVALFALFGLVSITFAHITTSEASRVTVDQRAAPAVVAPPAHNVDPHHGMVHHHASGEIVAPLASTDFSTGGESRVTTSQLVTAAGGLPVRMTAILSGAEEPNGGDLDGSGDALVTLNAALGSVCSAINISNISTPIAAHIHRSAPGVNGPIVVTLISPTVGSPGGCVEGINPAIIDAVNQDPTGHYVNVHTGDFPGGAIRGQLGIGVIAVADLTGAAEAPGPGDPAGTGMAIVTINQSQNTVCFDLRSAGIATPSVAHIHIGAPGVPGPIAVTLVPPVNGASEGCVIGLDPALVATMTRNIANHYVNVHNADFPNGAIRGQLEPALRLTTMLSGTNEAPGPGDPNGTGSAAIFLARGTGLVCFSLSSQNIATPTLAHIHNGAVGVAGPISVTLVPPVGGSSEGCVRNVPAAQIDAISVNPFGFYVNVHTADYPPGAVRGQLDYEGHTVRLHASMGDTVEIPPGDPDGTGTSTFGINPSRGSVCYTLNVAGIVTPTLAHIHVGPAGVAGPIVVHLRPPATGNPGSSTGCTLGVEASTLISITTNPAGHYVNIHNGDFPGGAVRGQLVTDLNAFIAAVLNGEVAGW